MVKKSHEEKNGHVLDIVHRLADMGRCDTVYRDNYLQRARKFLSQIQSYEDYRGLVRQQALLDDLPNKIRIAMNREDWEEVKKFGIKIDAVQRRLNGRRSLLELGLQVYDVHDVAIDPFSPGLHHMAGFSLRELPALRNRVVRDLGRLQEEDPAFKIFYASRRDAFRSLSFTGSEGDDSADAALDEADLEKQAQQALADGNMKLLEQVAELLSKKGKKDDGEPQEETSILAEGSARSARTFSFSQETLSKARALGLIAAHVDEGKEYAAYCRHAWHHPVFGEAPEKAWGATRMSDHEFAPDTPEALKRRIELYARHSLINSGGARHLPDFVAEDFLVEDFPEPAKGEEPSETALLSKLTLPRRRRISRMQIEHALFEQGPRIVEEELGLDPKDFRLVCIPSDLHLRFGKSRDWGRQEIWTHFDGYKIQRDGKLNALAGGDVRFGGIYDFVSIGREYESDRVIVRFAVVQRTRMTAF